MKKYKYYVYAFYTSFPKRILGFNSKNECLDYISGLRLSQTPYLWVEDGKNPKVIDVEYFNMSKEELIKQFESEEHL